MPWQVAKARSSGGVMKSQVPTSHIPGQPPAGGDAIEDLLGFTRDAEAFAQVITSEADIEDPFTIGVFGPWGSGKTFFLNCLQEAVNRCSLRKADRDPLHIVQINFNAWQYVEADLPTSLVTAILDGLGDRQVLGELESVRGTKEELQNEVEKLEHELTTTNKMLMDVEGKADEARLELATVSAEEWPLQLVSSNRGITSAWKFLFTGVSLWAFIVAMLFIVVAAAWTVILNSTSGLRAHMSSPLSLTIVWLGILAVLVILALVIAKLLQIRVFRARDTNEAKKEQAARIRGWDETKSKAERELERIRDRISELSQQRDRLNSNIEQAPSAYSVSDYLLRLAEDREHGGRLGMLALVRRDFHTLSRRLSGRDPTVEPRELPRRVVIYIDDLDRCPPQRVVATLEAVHLLLSFPLFIVVIAVDIRWLSASLQVQYSSMISPRQAESVVPGKDDTGTAATTLDYLEKIFQVPYWVPRLDHSRARRLMHAWVGTSKVPPSGPGHGSSAPSEVLAPAPTDDARLDLELLDELAPLLANSPRTLQRFVAVHRVLRATSAGRQPSNTGQGRAGAWTAADQQIAVMLLAIVHGVPGIAPALCNHLVGARDGSTVQAVFTSLDAAVGVHGTREWYRISRLIESYVECHATADWTVDKLRYWAARARQFSYFDYPAELPV